MRHPIVMRALLRAHARFAQSRGRGPAPAGVRRPADESAAHAGPPDAGGSGWDPYEVWHTRVLLAREARAARDAASPAFDGMPAGGVSTRTARLLAGAAELPLGEIDQDEDFDPEPGVLRGGLRPLDPDPDGDPDELDLALTDDLPRGHRLANHAPRRA